MVNPVITEMEQDVNGDIKVLKLGANKEDAYANIIEQGASAKLDNNKTATINVSTYTEPVVINPTSGKDGMKKATITLSNIPSGGGTLMLKCYKYYDSEAASDFFVFSLPTNDVAFKLVAVSPVSTEVMMDGYTYDSSTDTYTDGEAVYTRYEDRDLYSAS
jgi:hypothetical protein